MKFRGYFETKPAARRTAPDPHLVGDPPGAWNIMLNEALERAGQYGFLDLLPTFLPMIYAMFAYGMADKDMQATATVHEYLMRAYAWTVFGALVSDKLLGKYKTITIFNLIYIFGHFILMKWGKTVDGVHLGINVIAFASGGMKPLVSSHLGDQVPPGQHDLLRKLINRFYRFINGGATIGEILMPVVYAKWGAELAFGIPMVLQGLATVVFWMGRHKFVHRPASPGGLLGLLDVVSGGLLLATFGSLVATSDQPTATRLAISLGCFTLGAIVFAARQRIKPDNGIVAVVAHSLVTWLRDPKASKLRHFFAPARTRFGQDAVLATLTVLSIGTVFINTGLFWGLFHQAHSTWQTQAGQLDRHFTLPFIGLVEVQKGNVPVVNAILVLLLAPLVNWTVKLIERRLGRDISPLQLMGVGMVLGIIAFLIAAKLQHQINTAAALNQQVHIIYQLAQWVVITLGEIFFSITGLAFAYTQAPPHMKGGVTSMWNISISFGNAIVTLISKKYPMPLEKFFLVFAGLMAISTLAYTVRAYFYQYKVFPEASQSPPDAAAQES